MSYFECTVKFQVLDDGAVFCTCPYWRQETTQIGVDNRSAQSLRQPSTANIETHSETILHGPSSDLVATAKS